MKEASAKAQKELGDIDLNNSFEIKVGKTTFKVKHISQWCSTKISLLVAQKGIDLDSKDTAHIIKNNDKLINKCVSYAILGNIIKVTLFHAILWRYLYHFKDASEVYAGMEAVIEKLNVPFSLRNMLLLEQMNELKMKMTKMEALSYRQELLSESKQTS